MNRPSREYPHITATWQYRHGGLTLWEQQGRRVTPWPHHMPIWRELERGRRLWTLCAGCWTLLLLPQAPYCAGCAARRAAAQRQARRHRKRVRLRARLGVAA